MREIKRGTAITPSLLRFIFTKMFQSINEIDPTYISATTGQFVCKNSDDTKTSEMLSVFTDQYCMTDIMLDKYAGEEISCLQRYLDELKYIKSGGAS